MKSLKDVSLSHGNRNESTKFLSKICLVCEDENAKMNYSVRCCDSCKIFFRRHAYFDLNTNQCKYNGKCFITKLTRHDCRYCRLMKCLFVGMKKDLLRASHGSQSGIKSKEIHSNKSTIDIHPLDLLQNDRSLLTTNQWSLITNILNAYQKNNPTEYIRNLMTNQLNYPAKIRFKMANDNIMEIVSSAYVVIQPFIRIIPELNNLHLNDRTALIERNLRNLGGLNCTFIMHETEIFKEAAYSHSLLSTYGSWLYHESSKLSDNIDNDGTLIKLLLVILTFSTCSDVVCLQYDQNQLNNPSSSNYIIKNTKALFEIQNIYTEMMFKYMLYRYGYNQAALRFAYLIKNFLYQSLLTANVVNNCKHESMIQTVIEKAEQSLILED